jgi:hypothetical protein
MYKDSASMMAAAEQGSELRRMSASVADTKVLAVARYQLMLGEVRFGALDVSGDLEGAEPWDHGVFDTSADVVPN